MYLWDKEFANSCSDLAHYSLEFFWVPDFENLPTAKLNHPQDYLNDFYLREGALFHDVIAEPGENFK